MDRRRFVRTALTWTIVAPGAAHAQQPAKIARVGFLTASTQSSHESGDRRSHRDAFRGRLRELGWTEGQNLVIESRYAEGNYEKQVGHLPNGKSTAARSTGVAPDAHEPIDPRMPNLSPA